MKMPNSSASAAPTDSATIIVVLPPESFALRLPTAAVFGGPVGTVVFGCPLGPAALGRSFACPGCLFARESRTLANRLARAALVAPPTTPSTASPSLCWK